MRITRRATIALDDGPAGRTLVADLIPWNVAARVSDDGRSTFTETWQPGSLVADPGAVLPVFDGHMPTPHGVDHGPLIGRVIPLESSPAAFRARLELADTARARDVHALAELVGATVSIEADTPAPPANWDGLSIVRTAKDPSRLIGVAVELLPHQGAFPGAAVTAVRTQPPPEGEPVMPTATLSPTEPDTPDPDEPQPQPNPDEPTVTLADVDERIRGAVARIRVGNPGVAPSPLARYDTLQAAVIAGYQDLDIARHLGRVMVARVLADQLTTDSSGVIHQGWIDQIYGIVDQGRPAINAIGVAQLPAEGMTINWPTFAGDLTTLVGQQATQKTAITSVKVSIGTANAPLLTFAGGSDISLQLIRRSSPSYLETYLRIMASAYAAVTDKNAATGLSAQVTLARNNFVIYDPAAADATGSVLRTAIFTASTKVQTATGQPGSVVLAGLSAFIALGGKLTPAPVFNATGTATASTLEINVSGLRVVYDPYLAATEILVTNGLAAQWREDGPQTINSTDVEKLGNNYAVWGMALLTPTIPTGIVGLRTVAPTVEEQQANFDAGLIDEAPSAAKSK